MSACALAVPLVGASAAQADVAACATAGAAGPITPGVQAIIPDLATNTGDSLTNPLIPGDPPGDPLTDTDNGTREPNAGWEDGVYRFQDDQSLCLTVDTTDDLADTGLYSAAIDSNGAYDNTVCGTGLAIDRGSQDSTTVGLTPIVNPLGGPGEDVTDANYRVTFAAGNGPIQITATTSTGQTMSGAGVVHISPTMPGNCVTTNVEAFSVAAAFVVAG